MRRIFRLAPLAALMAVALSFVLVAGDADARGGSGTSTGTRGTRTFTAPPTTHTAPTNAAPIERTMTQPGQTTSVTRPAPAPGGAIGRPGGMFGGLFGGGLMGGLFAGFLGAGLFGLLFGHGLFGGLAGGFFSFIGLVLQIGLVVIVARLAWNWWQRRNAPAYAAAGPSLRDMMGGLGGNAGAPRPHVDLGGATPATQTGQPDEIGIQPADFDAFEHLLGEIQTAYGREDLAALRARLTPEMLSYFSEDLAKNASRGVVNDISDVKLLQGDLAEAWREGDVEYASVAMRFSLVDITRERSTSRIVEGGATPQEVTEVWTFMRSRGGTWLLSAIQQV